MRPKTLDSVSSVPSDTSTGGSGCPAATGSGWWQTAQAMKRALEGEGLVGRAEIVQGPGAGGTVGLARFVKERRGRGDAVLLTGLAVLVLVALRHVPPTGTETEGTD